jgi:hypothetical protein
MPNVPTTQLRHYPNDLLIASTFGRAVWSIFNATTILLALRTQSCPSPRTLIPATSLTPIDCVVSAWSAPSACSRTCGGGLSVQNRSIVTPPANGGAFCPSMLPLASVCNANPCSSSLGSACQTHVFHFIDRVLQQPLSLILICLNGSDPIQLLSPQVVTTPLSVSSSFVVFVPQQPICALTITTQASNGFTSIYASPINNGCRSPECFSSQSVGV